MTTAGIETVLYVLDENRLRDFKAQSKSIHRSDSAQS